MEKRKGFFTGLTADTFLLALTSLFADVATEMLYPVLPIFLTQTLGASASIVGVVEGVAEATQNIVQGFSGWVSDKLQKRKYIAIVGYAIAAISKPLIGVSASWQGVLTARFFDRLGTGTRSAPRDALIASSADEKHRGKAFGLEGIGDNFGAFLGPLFAIVLLFILHTNIRSIFYVAFIPAFLAVIMMLFVKERHVLVKAKTKLDFSVRRFPGAYWKYIFVTIVFGMGNSSNSFLILRTRNIGVPLLFTILLYAFFNLTAAVASYPAGTLSDKFGRKNILLVAFLIFLVTYGGFALNSSTYLVCFLFVFNGFYQGIFRSVGKALATDFVPQHLRASAVGWYATSVGLSSLAASIVAGELWTRMNPAAPFIFGAFFGVLGTIALLLLIPRKTHELSITP